MSENHIKAIAACIRDGFADGLDEGTSMHIARNIAGLATQPATSQEGEAREAPCGCMNPAAYSGCDCRNMDDFAREAFFWAESAATPTPPTVSDDLREAEREALIDAYTAGATDVHNHWTANPGEAPSGDPEFHEAASDYARAALAQVKAS